MPHNGSQRFLRQAWASGNRPLTDPSKAKGRGGTSPITVHFPKQVRDQLKILAVQQNKTLHALVAEAFNDLFAKYGKPEIAPADKAPQAE
ncbi:MAG: ribbon-helix-helix domain-containing protein [Terriglobales bacterium]